MIRKGHFLDYRIERENQEKGWKILLKLDKRILSLTKEGKFNDVKKVFKPYIGTWREPSMIKTHNKKRTAHSHTPAHFRIIIFLDDEWNDSNLKIFE